jgi:polysaccharide biosynthesis protein PslG
MSRSVTRRIGFGTRVGSGVVAGAAVAVLVVQVHASGAPLLRIGAGIGARPAPAASDAAPAGACRTGAGGTAGRGTTGRGVGAGTVSAGGTAGRGAGAGTAGAAFGGALADAPGHGAGACAASNDRSGAVAGGAAAAGVCAGSGAGAAAVCGAGRPSRGVARAAVRSSSGGSAAEDPSGADSPRGVDCGFHGLWAIYDDRERAMVLDRLRAAGVRSVRVDLSWVMLQPDGRGSYYRWGVDLVDHVIGMANARGIRPLMTLWLTPPWANGGAGERVPPDDPADYARVAGWAAARWRGNVIGWEIWNEPNSPAFLAGADPVAYVRLLRAAYPAIKAAAPEAPVVFGGLEYNDTDWISRAYGAGAGGAFDVLATHPYQGIADLGPRAEDGTKWTLRHAAAVRRLMVEHGDGGKPIWFTEFGWSTHTNATGLNWLQGVSEAEQAGYLAQTAALVGRDMPYVTRIYWSTDRDLDTGDVQYRNYGLFRRDLSPKPALATLADVNQAAGRR